VLSREPNFSVEWLLALMVEIAVDVVDVDMVEDMAGAASVALAPSTLPVRSYWLARIEAIPEKQISLQNLQTQ